MSQSERAWFLALALVPNRSYWFDGKTFEEL
jgi:hypothetical protein